MIHSRSPKRVTQGRQAPVPLQRWVHLHRCNRWVHLTEGSCVEDGWKSEIYWRYIYSEAIFGVSFLGGSGVSIKGVKIVRDTLRETNIQGHYSRTPQSNPENRLTVYLPFSKHQRVINQWPLKIISWKIKFPCWALTMFHCELLALGRFVFYILGHMNITHTDIERFYLWEWLQFRILCVLGILFVLLNAYQQYMHKHV